MRSTTGGQHDFARVPSANIQRSSFDRSCGLKTTFDAGLLVPIFLDEALPGDTMSMQLATFARLATPLHPVMDNIYMDTFFFFVPNRLLWENWERFNGAQDDPTDSVDFLVPELDPVTYTVGSLGDYFGFPTDVGAVVASALWSRAYNLIFNTWFRDQNLQDSVIKNVDDGPDDPADYTLLRRGKRHDYMTSCLPFPQKGPSVTLPLGGDAPGTVDVAGNSFGFTTLGDIEFEIDGTSGINIEAGAQAPSGSDSVDFDQGGLTNSHAASIWNSGMIVDIAGATVTTDLSAATAATINSIREAFQVQRLYERDARGGTRYTEVIKAHFGVSSPDQRLQRPEYLGGGSTAINITPVPQTSASDTQPTEQGNLAAYGIASSNTHGFTKSFVEHGVILGLISVRADLNYQQGLERQFSRRTRFDFFWPALAHLGEQEVLNKEIYFQNQPADDLVFGYQERFAEYRYKPSKITGEFRSTFATSIDTWHLAQEFITLPILGNTFIQENPPIDRVIAVPSEPHFLLDCFFKFRCVRPMPMYGVPGNIDRF